MLFNYAKKPFQSFCTALRVGFATETHSARAANTVLLAPSVLTSTSSIQFYFRTLVYLQGFGLDILACRPWSRVSREGKDVMACCRIEGS